LSFLAPAQNALKHCVKHPVLWTLKQFLHVFNAVGGWNVVSSVFHVLFSHSYGIRRPP
jgi:hypothetical protein